MLRLAATGQVSVSGASPYYLQSVTPTDSGRGYSSVDLILEYVQVRSEVLAIATV